MENKTPRSRFLSITVLKIAGVILLILLSVSLLWHGNANSMQATPAIMAQVYFDGEYRIADGEWQAIEEDSNIPSTKGDVTLRGNFHMLAPDGTYVGIYSGELPVALYANHLNLTIIEGDNEPFVFDTENPLYGNSACGEMWFGYSFLNELEDPIEIQIHNPHLFGNETAIDEMLDGIAIWSGIDFEKDVLASGETQRYAGLFFLVSSLVFLGSALFSTLIHTKRSKILWLLGLVVVFAGTYLAYSADGVYFWSASVVTNTTILGVSMIFYMLFLCMALVHFLNATKTVGTITMTVLGAADLVLFLLPMATDLLFYDLWLYWVAVQILVNIVLCGCLVREFLGAKGKKRWWYLCSWVPLIAFIADVVMIDLGIWKNGIASPCVFVFLFVAATIMLLKVIPESINAVAKTKELETEKIVLGAQLTESRMSTMMSQIRPHFIYNTLGSIEQLCYIDPQKAGELVHNFAKYLRGNFRELDNPKPILMSQEMEHVHHYVSIENVRFPDMTFTFEMNSDDFHIPALTIQPIVENAIKHGLMKLPKGGTIRVVSYETDTHYCVLVEDDGAGFDTGVLLEDRKHVGIRNIRERLQAMVNGTLEIESTIGVGTKVHIRIPKEADK